MLIFRNDTDYSEAAKVIFDLFPSLSRKNVKAETDPQIGYSIPGGVEITLGSEDSGKMICRKDGSSHYCKFIVKKPI